MGTTWRFSVVHWYPLIPNNTHTALGYDYMISSLRPLVSKQNEQTTSFLPIKCLSKNIHSKKQKTTKPIPSALLKTVTVGNDEAFPLP